MQQNESSMSVAQLQKMMHTWKSRNITDATTTKLLELYLGLTGYMNSQKIYPQENFYEIRNSLRFSTTQALIEAMKRSQSFPFVTDPATGAVKAFWSPLFHEPDSEIQTEEDNGLSSQTFAQTFVPTDNNYIINNKYNTLSEERTSNRSSSPKDHSPKDTDSHPSEENFLQEENSTSDVQLTKAAQEFFHHLNSDQEEKAQILVPLIGHFQQQEGVDRPQACRMLVCLVNEHLIPYFASQPKFMKIPHKGRIAWLVNLLKSAHGQHLTNTAAQCIRLKCKQEATENTLKKRNELRNFHPLSPHEWTDRESGLRFYEDETEGTVLIPAEAPPRPDASALWNVLSKEWNFLD